MASSEPIPQLLSMPEAARILVVRRDNIGDLVCTTPMLRSLREAFPKARIGVLVNVYNAEVLTGNLDIDDIFVYEKIKHVRGCWHKIRTFFVQGLLKLRLRAWRPSVSILARANYDRHGLKYLRSIGATNIIGYRAQDGSKQPDFSLVPRDFASQHETEFLADLLKPLGVFAQPGPLRMYPCRDLEERARSRLSDSGLKIAVHISARDPERQWGINQWAELSEGLLTAYPNIDVIMLWAPGQEANPYVNGEDRLAADLISKVCNPRFHPMPVKTVSELVAAIQVCDGFIGADGGAMHIAAALQKPSVILFEKIPAKWRHWYPWQAPAEIIKSETDAIASIPVAAVMKAVQGQIECIQHAHERT